MARKDARRAAMQLLFEWSFNGCADPLEDLPMAAEDVHLTDADKEYVESVLAGVREHIREIDEHISKNVIGWKFERIAKVDLAILRLALYEIFYRDDIPASVSANEAVELAKEYSGEKSAPFINGILGKLIREQGI